MICGCSLRSGSATERQAQAFDAGGMRGLQNAVDQQPGLVFAVRA